MAHCHHPVRRAFRELSSTTPFGAGAVVLSNEKQIFAFGGGGHQASVYDIATDTWSPLAAEPVARRFASAAWFSAPNGDGEIWVFGGQDEDDPEHKGVRTIDVYDLVTDRWRFGGETAAPLVDAVVVQEPSSGMTVVGRVMVEPGVFITRTDTGTITDGMMTQWTWQPATSTPRSLSGTAGIFDLVLAGGLVTATGRPTDIVERLQLTIGL